MPDNTQQIHEHCRRDFIPKPEVDKEDIADQAVERLSKQPGTIRDLLKGVEFQAAVAEVLPQVVKPARFVRVALTALMRTPQLLDCTKASLFRCMFDLAMYGIEPDGRRAHLIPFKNRKTQPPTTECTLILDYKGIVELVRRSGEVSDIHADVVYEKDEWDFSYGSHQHLTHKPNLTAERGTRRNLIAAYSYVRLKDGSQTFMVLSSAEIEKSRKRSKTPDDGPWVTDYDEMAKKTAFRRHSKWLPLASETARKAVEQDEDAVDVDAISTWSGMLEEGDATRPTVRDRIMNQPSFKEDEKTPEPKP